MATTTDPNAAVRIGSAPAVIEHLLKAPGLALVARILLTSAFWSSGIAKLIDFQGATAEVAVLGLPLPMLVAALTILVQIGGSMLVILDRWTWLGAGSLAIFKMLATLLAHAFWTASAGAWGRQFATFMEHLGLVGSFLLVAILSSERRRP